MFLPARMKKIRGVVLSDCAEDVLRELSAYGTVHLVNARELLQELGLSDGRGERLQEKCSELLRRITYLVDVLELAGTESAEKLSLVRKQSRQYLDDIESNLGGIESEVSAASEQTELLQEERVSLRRREAGLEALQSLGIQQSWLGRSDFLHTVSGFIDSEDVPELERQLSIRLGAEHVLELSSEAGKRKPMAVAVLPERGEDLEALLGSMRFEAFQAEGASAAEVRERLEEVEGSLEESEKKLAGIRARHGKRLLAYREIAEVEGEMARGFSKLAGSGRVHAFEGWVPEKKLKATLGAIEGAAKGSVCVRVFDPEKDENVPVLLDNPSLVKSFESITKSYGLPMYNEIDPTLFMAFSFPLIFGMMFGDIGHGAIIALAGFFLLKKKKDDPAFGRILMACGMTSILFGFMYGSLFGREDILHAYWLSPFHDVKEGHTLELFGFALFIGVLHMGLGLLINAANRARAGGLGNTLLGSIGRLMLFLTVGLLITKFFGFPIPVFEKAAGTSPSLIGLFGILLPMGLIVFEEVLHEFRHTSSFRSSLGAVGNGMFEALDSIIMFLSNTISYSRILILALIHAMVSEVIFVISNLVHEIAYVGFLLYYLVLIGGTVLLILALEGLVVYIHTLRLHFYEWFTKFYKAGGLEYNPFRINREYTFVKD
ncbi:MAG: V-type ATP synthase subunit I [Candidatus Altiarchaeota archaeon]